MGGTLGLYERVGGWNMGEGGQYIVVYSRKILRIGRMEGGVKGVEDIQRVGLGRGMWELRKFWI